MSAGGSPPGGMERGVSGGSPPVALQQTTVIQVGSQKSVAGAVLLGFFFGPLGMLYATVPGALVMFVISLVIVIPTLGLGLIVTIPACAIWAGIAANSHNNRLGVSSQHAALAQGVASPAGWRQDPAGSGRLRFYDGVRWTDNYADQGHPAAASTSTPEPPPQLPEATADAPGEEAEESAAESEEATAVVDAPGKAFCGSCGDSIAPAARFCSSCGATQEIS